MRQSAQGIVCGRLARKQRTAVKSLARYNGKDVGHVARALVSYGQLRHIVGIFVDDGITGPNGELTNVGLRACP